MWGQIAPGDTENGHLIGVFGACERERQLEDRIGAKLKHSLDFAKESGFTRGRENRFLD